MTVGRDFAFTDKDFRCIQQLVSEHTGIALSDAKQDMVYSRLSRRVRALKLDNFRSYCQLISKEKNDQELIEFVNSITTNLTSFFRENHHFEFLRNELLPQLLRDKQDSRRLRIWSAGCSSGEEPYSLAMVARESVPADWDLRILATDLDSNVLARAASGIYDAERVEGLPRERLKRWFRKGVGNNAGKVRLVPELQSLISFKQLNLMKAWPVNGPLDIIFCRNVVIYFDKPTQRILFDRYADLLHENGHLFVGHSESLFKVSERFKLLGKTIYQRTR